MNNNVIEYMRCPICCEIPPGSIFICSIGHSVCGECIYHTQNGTSCRASLNGLAMQNFGLEQLVEAKTFDCPNKERGCPEMYKRRQLYKHNKVCKFSPEAKVFCTLLGFQCDITYNPRDAVGIADHLLAVHNINVQGAHETIHLNASDAAQGGKCHVLLRDYAAETSSILLCISRETCKIAFSCIQIGAVAQDGDVGLFLTVTDTTPRMYSVLQAFNLKHISFALENPGFRIPVSDAANESYSIECKIIIISKMLG